MIRFRDARRRPQGRRPTPALPMLCAGFGMVLHGCAPPPKPVAVPPQVPVATAPAAPLADWRDLPLSPGRWTYLPSAANPSAQFARPGAVPDFVIGCDRKTRLVTLFRAGAGRGPMTVTTSYSGQDFPTQSAPDGLSTALPATSDFLDRIAFSRGHVTVEVGGRPLLVLPAWAEPARVIEDCRA